jgi:hypothetical protein
MHPVKSWVFVTPTPVDWNGETGSALLGRVMAVVSTCDFSHSRESVFSTKWQQSYVYHTGSRKTPNIQLIVLEDLPVYIAFLFTCNLNCLYINPLI